MNDSLNLLFSLLAGVMLGSVFFAGLWWTVRRGLTAKQPAILFLFSFLLRTAAVVAGFYVVLGDNWIRLLAGLCGFFIARILITRLTRTKLSQEAAHASES